MKWPEGRKWGDSAAHGLACSPSGSATSGAALPAGDMGHVPQPLSAPHQIDRLSLVPHRPWVFGVSGCSWLGQPGAGVGWSSGALAHPGLPAWLRLSQETGSPRSLQIAPYKLSASWAATRHKYSLSLRLRWARPTSPPRAWGPRLPAPARLRARRAPGPLPGRVSRVRVPHAVPDQEAEACTPSQHCRSLPSGPLRAELGPPPAKPAHPPSKSGAPQPWSVTGGRGGAGMGAAPQARPRGPRETVSPGAEGPSWWGSSRRGLRACSPSSSGSPHTQSCLPRGMAPPRPQSKRQIRGAPCGDTPTPAPPASHLYPPAPHLARDPPRPSHPLRHVCCTRPPITKGEPQL